MPCPTGQGILLCDYSTVNQKRFAEPTKRFFAIYKCYLAALRWQFLAIAPKVVVASDITHLHLPATWVVGRIGQYAALESLNEHISLYAACANTYPICLADRIAQCEDPIDEWARAIATIVDRAAGIKVIPEHLRQIVSALGYKMRQARLLALWPGITANLPGAVER